MKIWFTASLLIATLISTAQDLYIDSLQRYQDNYVKDHEVVKGEDKKKIHFFAIDSSYRVTARFIRTDNSKWFTMETSGAMKKTFRIFGTVEFTIHDTTLQLNIYQSQSLLVLPKYKDHLFLPFTDLSSGDETYAAGRYIDLNIPDINGDKVIIDFNKAYNPYCAYVSGKYNCPIPPKENQLNFAIRAGEMNYGIAH